MTKPVLTIRRPDEPVYETRLGSSFCLDSLAWIPTLDDDSVDLVMTSPPFALLRPKEYGNKVEGDYLVWLLGFMDAIKPKLKDTGSVVVDLGGAYQRGIPADPTI